MYFDPYLTELLTENFRCHMDFLCLTQLLSVAPSTMEPFASVADINLNESCSDNHCIF